MIPYRTTAERAAASGRVRAHLVGGRIVAYPTETVYGLGGLLEPTALDRLVQFKGNRPFLLLARGRDDVPGLDWTPAALRLAERFWPGPLTLALTDPETRYPAQVRGPDGAVAVRVSPHPAVAALLEAAGGPITSTSANRPGHEPARDAVRAGQEAAGVPELLVLDGGRLPAGPPSTIVRCGDRTTVIREAAIPRAEIEAVVELA